MPIEHVGLHVADNGQGAGNILRRLIKEADRTVAGRGGEEKNQHDTENESPVTDSIGDECLLGGWRGLIFVEIKPNQQVGAQADTFPTDKHQEEVVGEHQREHREHEQIQVCKEPVVTAIAMHVTGGKNVNQQTDESDKQRINATEPIHGQTEVRAKTSDLNPCPQVIHDRLRCPQGAIRFEGQKESSDGGQADGSTGDDADELLVAQPPANEPIDCGAGKRREDD